MKKYKALVYNAQDDDVFNLQFNAVNITELHYKIYMFLKDQYPPTSIESYRISIVNEEENKE